MGASAGVELGRRTSLRVFEVGIGTVNQIGPVHDGEVPRVIDRKEYVSHAHGSEVAVRSSTLQCVGEERVALGGQSREKPLSAAEVVPRCGVTDTELGRQRAKT